MAYQNGRIPESVLRTVAPGTQLLSSVASAYRTLVLVAKEENIIVTPVDSHGSGYRDYAMQQLFWNASHGNRADQIEANIDPNLDVAIAAPGQSTHGNGNRIDMLFNGHSPDAIDIAVAGRYGFSREFGAADKNHFEFTGEPHGPTDSDRVRIIAMHLNKQHLSVQSDAANDGTRGRRYFTMLQEAAVRDKIDPRITVTGNDGPRTRAIEQHYWDVLWQA